VLLLGFDTATPAVTVAVYDGTSVVASHVTVDARRHGELLAPLIQRVLTEAKASPRDLDGIAVGVGPGPYTGLRVGVVTALSLGDALGVPVHGVCTLDVLAAQAGVGEAVTVLTDARRREVFWASYDADGKRIAGPAVGRPADVAGLVTGRIVGAGAQLYPEAFGDVSGPVHPDAGVLCAVVAGRLTGAPGELLPARPIYLRRPDTAEPRAPKTVTPA
jgi:tRNA threonylcarbamoyl adenosine modification protein YeaZ